MKVFIGCDHAAYDEKIELIKFLNECIPSLQIEDLGTHSKDRANYPDFAIKVCKKVLNTKDSRGILICGTGIGMSMTANRFKGIRASLCRTEKEATATRGHNNANVLCLGARTTQLEIIKQVSKVWFETEFEGGRHAERVALFNDLGEDLS